MGIGTLTRFAWALTGAALLVLVAGCEREQQPLRVGTNVWIGYEPLYLAEHLREFDAAQIRMVTMHNATEVQQAMRAGTIEVAALTLDECLNLAEEGMAIRVVLVTDESNGADVVLARPEIETLADLRGKRIAVESTAVGAVLLQAALDAGDLTPADVVIVDLGVQDQASAYRDGLVDAVVTFEPERSELMAAGARLLYDSSRIPGRILDVLVTTEQVAASRAADLRALVAGHFRAVDYYRANPMEAAANMTRRQGLAASQIVAAYDGVRLPDLEENRRLLTGAAPPLNHAAGALARMMLEQHLLRRPLDLHELADGRFLPAR